MRFTWLVLVVLGVASLGCGADGGASAETVDAGSEGNADAETTDVAAEIGPADTTMEPEVDWAEVVTTSIEAGAIVVGEFTFEALAVGPLHGELVLLLHGFPATSEAWRAELTALAQAGYRAVAIDQRGYSPGARPMGIDAYAMPLLVQDVLGVADALEADRFHLVGHDWGSAVAWTVAALFPDRLRSLTTLSVPHPTAYQEALRDPESCQAEASGYISLLLADNAAATLLAANAAGLRLFWGGLDASVIEAYLSVLGTEPALEAALNWYRANLDPAAPTGDIAIPPVSVPTLFIWGDQDPAVCRDAPEATADHVSGPYRFEVLAGVGHWLPELAADEVIEALLLHLAEHP